MRITPLTAPPSPAKPVRILAGQAERVRLSIVNTGTAMFLKPGLHSLSDRCDLSLSRATDDMTRSIQHPAQ